MGRRKTQGSSVDIESSGWESNSCRSIAGYSSDSGLQDSDVALVDLFSQNIDNLFEKRRETRERALAALQGFYRQDVRAEEAMQNETTIISRCVALMKRGGATEATLACQLLGLHFLTLPEQNESHLQEVQIELYRVAKSGDSAEARAMAADTLAIATLVNCEDDLLCKEIMEQFQSLWSTGSNKVVAAAVRGWCLAFTRLTMPLDPCDLEDTLRRLSRLLQGNDSEVRAAAGEALCLVYHCTRTGQQLLQRLADEDCDFDRSQCTAADNSGVWCEEGEGEGYCDGEVAPSIASEGVTGEVVEKMRQLAVSHPTQGSMKAGKKERKANKTTFKSLLASLERGAPPTTRVKLQKGDTLTVISWEGHTRLNALRTYLAGGFQAHLQHNPLLHQIFGYTPRQEAASRLTSSEKRMLRSPNSLDARWRTHERKGNRAFKNARHAPVYEDEE